MARISTRFAKFAAAAAALSLAATPAAARGGWYHHRHHDRGIDAGDVLAGVLILGGIAAVASAASKSKREEEYRRDYPPREHYRSSYPDDRYDYREAPRSYASGGLGNAADICVDQVERGQERVASVDNAARTGDGWHISGQLEQGDGFSCWIDNDGRIRNVDVGGGYYSSSFDDTSSAEPEARSAPSAGNQWTDAAYARARAQAAPASPYDGTFESDEADAAEIDGDLNG